MTKVSDVLAVMEKWAPVETKMSYDNVGLLVGNADAEVTGILVAMDITPDTVEEAVNAHLNLIVSHHPIIFNPIYSITGDGYLPATLRALIKNDINAVCMHTNLDVADGGVSDALAESLELTSVERVEGNPALRKGFLPKTMSSREFAEYTAKILNTPVKYTESKKPIRRVAVCGGAGGGNEEYYCAKASGCDAYVSGEFKHHILVDAKYSDFTVVDAGHFDTEWDGLFKMYSVIDDNFNDIICHISMNNRPEHYVNPPEREPLAGDQPVSGKDILRIMHEFMNSQDTPTIQDFDEQ